MKLLVDDQPIGADVFDSAVNVEDAVRCVQKEMCPPGRMVVAIRCDGHEVAGGEMSATLRRAVAHVDRLELVTGTKRELVVDAMMQAAAALEDSGADSQQAAQLLTEGETTAGIERLSQCVDIWQQVHAAVTQSVKMLDLDLQAVSVNDEPLIELLTQPKDMLLQIRNALRAQDHVLLADVLQYEMEDVAERWHAVIARVRRAAEEA